MFTSLRTFILAILIASPVTVFAMSSAPKYCPGVEVIKQTPFTRAEMDSYIGWVTATENSKYDTEDEWTTIFVVGNHDSNGKDRSESEAIAFANTILPRVMMGEHSPAEDKGKYFCFYYDNKENPQVMVIAISPAYQGIGEQLLKMKKMKSIF